MNIANYNVIEVDGKLIGYVHREGTHFKSYITKHKPPGRIIGVFKVYEMAVSALVQAHLGDASPAH